MMDTASRITFERYAWRRTADGVYRRLLGDLELGFYWHMNFNGVSVLMNHVEFETSEEVVSSRNVEAAWIRLKQRFPMLGAYVEELPTGEEGLEERVEFVLDEKRLASVRSNELIFHDAETVHDVERLCDELQNGILKLCNDLIFQLWLVRRKDVPRRYHLVTHLVHYISDGIGAATITREFLHELASLDHGRTSTQLPLGHRIKSLLPIELLHPSIHLPLPRRRWRYGIAKVICNIRHEKLSGGQTLPTKSKNIYSGMPARAATINVEFPAATTSAILRTCRAQRITFSNALPVLSQLGLARLLRRRNITSLSPSASSHRRTQPTYFYGPLDLRPHLDERWRKQGGAEETCIAIGFYALRLPFVPMPHPHPSRDLCSEERSACISQEVKPSPDELAQVSITPLGRLGRKHHAESSASFFSLLTPNRFLYRARIVQSQTKNTVRHPLAHEIQVMQGPDRIRMARVNGLAWRRHALQQNFQDTDHMTASEIGYEISYNDANQVFMNAGSSVGDRDALVPSAYPILNRNNTQEIRLQVLRTSEFLRVHPSELYLGAFTSRGVLKLFCFADTNVYEEDVVKEWIQDIADAAVAYLGGKSPIAFPTGAKL